MPTDARPTALDHYRLLGKSGLRVSPMALGTMTFGADWGWGADDAASRLQFESYAERGGNFIDTANFYTNGSSERILGELLQGRRERFVLATKFTLSMRERDPNAAGNGRKNIQQAVEASLRRLKTDHVDLYWLHAWDGLTPIDEVMRALDDLVRMGKVLYVGASDAPAWKVAEANTLAELRGWSRFIGLQIEYSLTERTVERELVPMARAFGIGITPWSPLAQGVLTGKYTAADLSAAGPGTQPGRHARNISNGRLNPRTLAIALASLAIAIERGIPTCQVALAWLLQQPGVASPIVGARTVEQLNQCLDALKVQLDSTELKRLDDVSHVAMGFPHDFLSSESVSNIVRGGVAIFSDAAARPIALRAT
jgi:aryl-alcohol dehydrogenase-like predicted oxidoreductase